MHEKLGAVNTELLYADAQNQVMRSDELEMDLLTQAETVSLIVEDMRRKILDDIKTQENLLGYLFGEVDDYL